ncbi:MAG: hypothetical protein ACI9GZ_002830 [Bacteroidia bacterium]|jgi:hypothetical protein
MKNILFPIFAIILFGSCNIDDLEFDNIKDLEYSAKVAIPLGSASYTIKELIEDLEDDRLEINEGSDLALSFIYRDNSSFEISTDFVDFGIIENNITYNLGLLDSPIPAPNAFTIPIAPVAFTFEFPEDTGGDLIDSLFYSSASLTVQVSSTFDGNIDYTATMIGIKRTANNADLTISSNVNSTFTDTNQTSLAGYKTIFDNSAGANQFQFILEGNINVPAGALAKSSDKLDLNVTISNIELSQVYGDFGLTEVEIQDQSIDFDGFEDFSNTGLELGDPKVILDVTNYYGIPIKIDMSGMTVRDKDGGIVSLAGDISDNGIIINSPTIAGGKADTHIEISKENSNIQELLRITPVNITVPIIGTTNPEGSPGPQFNNFLIDQSAIEVMATIEIPLDFKMSGFSTEVEFDISDIDIEDANSMDITLFTKNQLPIDGTVKLMILDANDNISYEISNLIILKSPPVGPDGRTTNTEESSETIELDQVGIDAFINGKTIVANIEVDSFDASNDIFVKIFSDYTIDFELSFSGEFTTTIEID